MEQLKPGDVIESLQDDSASRVIAVMGRGKTEAGHTEMVRYETGLIGGPYDGTTLIMGHEEITRGVEDLEISVVKKEDIDKVSKKTGRAPNDEGKQISMIFARSAVGQLDGSPKVELTVAFSDGTEHQQMGTPDQARSLAFGILEAAVEAERDAALVDFAMGNRKRNPSVLADALSWLETVRDHRAAWFEKLGQ